MDYAAKKTDEEIRAIERRLRKEYRRAAIEMQEKVDDYFRRFKKKDETWSRWVKEGKKTKEEYKTWRKGQLIVGKRWEDMRDNIAADMANTNAIARSIVVEHEIGVYALNHNWSTYEIERGSHLNTGYVLYSRESVARLMRDNPKLLPDPGRETERRILYGLDVRYNRQVIQSVAMQGIVQGMSIPEIAKRLVSETGERNYKAATRNARTMMTCAQNAGRQDSYERAQRLGIQMQKCWVAVLDMRTRHAHRLLDGQTVPVNEYFESENGLIMYPGDPNASPADIYNCRCTTIGQIKGHEINTRLRNDPDIDGMSYEEWKYGKEERPNPILLPEEKSEAIKMSYIAGYRK